MESASEQPAERFGRSTRLSGASTLADSAMKWTPQKTMVDCGTFRPDDGELERVADVVGDLLDLRQLVVVGEDHRVLLAGERPDLLLERADVLRGKIAAGGGVRHRIVHRDDGEAHGWSI